MTQINTRTKQAFTLVELIVVITILAILGTIAFISFTGYTQNSRDGVRIADINSTQKSLELYITEKGTYPIPDNGTNITYLGGTARTQGIIGDNVLTNISKINKKPLDPLTQTEYTYSVTASKTEYEIGAIYEGSIASNKIIPTTYAAGKKGIARIKGNYNGLMLKVSTGGIFYVLAVPSIINNDLTVPDLLTNINNNSQVYNGYSNLPESYKKTSYEIKSSDQLNFVNTGKLLIYSGSMDYLGTETGQIDLVKNLQLAYNGTLLQGSDEINNLLTYNAETDRGGTMLVGQILIKKLINPKIVITGMISSGAGGTTIQSNSIGLNFNKMSSSGSTINNDSIVDIIYDNGKYITVGSTSKSGTPYTSNAMIISKYNENLSLENSNSIFYNQRWGSFSSIIKDNNSYVAVGSHYCANLDSRQKIIIKFNSESLVEEKRKENTCVTNLSLGLRQVIDNGTNYIAAGFNNGDFLIEKYDKELNILNSKIFGGTGNEQFNKIIQLGEEYFLFGTSTSNLSSFTGGSANAGGNDFVIAKLDKDFNVIKIKNFGGTGQEGMRGAIKDGENLIFVGSSDSNLSSLPGDNNVIGGYDSIIARLDSNLNLIKINTFGGTGYDSSYNIIKDNDKYIIVGYSDSNLSSYSGGTVSAGSSDFYISKFDIDFNLEEINNLGGISYEGFNGLTKGNNSYIAIGTSSSNLSSFTGGTTNMGSDDHILVEFK